jgi:hypothetical protein
MKRFIRLLIYFNFFQSFSAFGQATISNELFGSAGSTFTNSTCHLSFSVGEIVTSYFQSGTLMVTQGFQQPMSWKKTPSLSLTDYATSGVAIYPNPFLSTITILNENYLQFDCRLYDITNRLIAAFTINEHIHSYDLSSLPAGTYQLVFVTNTDKLFTFPLIKIN